jgi:hypothetical protein
MDLQQGTVKLLGDVETATLMVGDGLPQQHGVDGRRLGSHAAYSVEGLC